ncbi:Rpn family recombination-promoting nuclease/putative transposase [Clostridium perfringens]|uniref:Rpn family recombination-promoting nuclease/putative transposase n=1 Tax=Clostridium perfringens TaxID=1502 RepID=UPI00156FF9D7|nr:Rpn family recombination-promoting nuclease/putative transposase [Clostridium perfringens]MBI6024463.1 Rpn family recombination-promoting nuclease/putative transposase [Clostridium perfringens]MBI6048550.1 Rpn family recombination-promoting nuclease/putative transposase [Clostridium perfringens]MDK0553705.1 Rpn family recombination-promoting nuclease/putative transposase [Clostridium perfringens]MDK0575095.1 Rpn family recombination-promoting nuclease/putative transposase [Clostridium perfri
MIMNPRIPYIFKKIFVDRDNTESLIDFFNSILNLEHKIKHLEILDNHVFSEFLCENSKRIDTICYLDNDESKNITIQIANSCLSLNNIFKLFEENSFKKIQTSNSSSNYICITILNSNYFNTNLVHSIYKPDANLLNTIGINEIHFIELEKFQEIDSLDDSLLNKTDSLSQWLMLLKEPESYATRIFEFNNSNIRKIKSSLYKLNSDSSLKAVYDLYEKSMYDEISAYHYALNKGIEKGRLKAEKIVIAQKLLDFIDIETICELTELTEEEIKNF